MTHHSNGGRFVWCSLPSKNQDSNRKKQILTAGRRSRSKYSEGKKQQPYLSYSPEKKRREREREDKIPNTKEKTNDAPIYALSRFLYLTFILSVTEGKFKVKKKPAGFTKETDSADTLLVCIVDTAA